MKKPVPVCLCILCGIVLVLLIGLVIPVRSPDDLQTENVVLVNIDGLRSLEGVGYDVGKGTHPNLPHLWHELRPQGTLVTKMSNRDYTKTLSALSNILTGTWNIEPNRAVHPQTGSYRDVRGMFPTLIEHYRRDAGASKSSVLYLPSKHNGRNVDASFHPAYGEEFGATTVFFNPRNTPYRTDGNEFIDDTNTDDRTFEEFVRRTRFEPEKTPEDYPSFVVVDLGITDNSGHHGAYDLHLDVIRNVDEILGSMWEHLVDHPHYGGKTTFIVTTDHGRHLPEYGGIIKHTGGCLGCRSTFAMFLGPDTPQGLTVTRRTYQIDLAPTVARLLSIELPYAIGRAIHEVIGENPESTRNDTLTQLAMTSSGNEIFVVYRENVDDVVEIVLRRGVVDQSGVELEPPVLLTDNFTGVSYLAKDPSIAINESGLIVAWMQHRGHRDSLWESWTVSSPDLGDSFPVRSSVAREVLENENGTGYKVPAFPHCVSGTDSDVIIGPMYEHGNRDEILWFESENGFITQHTPIQLDESGVKAAYYRSLDSVTYPDGTVGLVFARSDLMTDQELPDRSDRPTDAAPPMISWEIFYRRVPLEIPPPTDSFRRGEAVRLTDNRTPSLGPTIAMNPSDPGHIAVSYADTESSNGRMQVFLTQSFDRGSSWTDALQVTDSETGAWQPALVIDPEGNIHITYVDYAFGNGDVHALTVNALGEVGPTQNLSDSPQISENPHIAQTDDFGRVVVWIEGNAEIRTARPD